MRITMIAPSGEEYTFTEPKYIRMQVVKDDGREVVYWIKESNKGKGHYMNSQPFVEKSDG